MFIRCRYLIGRGTRLIVLGFQFKEALGVGTYGAGQRCLFADYDVSAVATYPYSVVFTREYNSFLDIGEQTAVAFLVMTFDSGYSAEFGGNMSEAFFLASAAMRSYMSVHS